MVIAGVHLAVCLVFRMSAPGTQASIGKFIVATPSGVFEHGRVWTLASSPFFEDDFLRLALNLFLMWGFVPTMERFWGTPRFYRFFAITALAGTVAGVLVGWALGLTTGIYGLTPFVTATLVAFGVTHARAPVQFFGVLPLTARQMMYGWLVVSGLVVLFGRQWAAGAALAGACLAAVLLTSRRWSPALAWKKWRLARMRRRLSVIEGGVKPPRKRDEQRWLN